MTAGTDDFGDHSMFPMHDAFSPHGCGIVVLAAGASTRMGTPKQLLPIQGVSLLRRAASAALDARCAVVVVVLGAHADWIRPELSRLPVMVAQNTDWSSGLSSSVRCGMKTALMEHAQLRSIILSVADQPRVTAETFRRLLDARQETRSGLVAASYSGTAGTPALFARAYFPELLGLSDRGGAKTILQKYHHEVVEVNCPEAALDVDTPDDYSRLVQLE